MVWIMAALFLVSLILMARMQPKIEGQKPAGLEDFNFPSAAERPIQVVFGTRKVSGPNVLWYGDLKTRPITQKIKTLFTTKKTVIGHRYYMGMQLGICHGPDVQLKKVFFGDKLAWDGLVSGEVGGYTSDTGIFSISNPNLFGGDESGGGVSGKVQFFGGSNYQRANSYLKSKVGDQVVSPLKTLSYAVFEGFYIGNSPSPAAISFEVSRFPKAPRSRLFEAGNSGFAVEKIGDDANPAFIIYELLTDKRFGAAIPKSLIDPDSFLLAASKLHLEGFGLSLVIDSSSSAGQVISDILKVIQGSIVDDPASGVIKLRLVRNDYSVENLDEINPTNAKSISGYSSGSLESAVNEVKIKYLSRESDYQERTAISQNNGVRLHKGDVESRTYSMPQVTSPILAAKIAQREMSALSAPLKTCTAECHRGLSHLMIGDVVKLNWPPLWIDAQVMRVTGVDLGSPGDGAIKISLVQDIFGVFSSSYADGSEASWVKPSNAPVDVSRFLVIDAPAVLADGRTRSMLVAAENPGSAIDYLICAKSTGDSGFVSTGEMPFTPVFSTTSDTTSFSDVIYLTGFVDDIEGCTTDEARQGLGLYLVQSNAGTEWVSCQNVSKTDKFNARLVAVKRGVLGTKPLSHPAGALVWAISEGYGLTAWQYQAGAAVDVKMLTRTLDGRLTEASALTRVCSIGGLNEKPWPPGRLRINGVSGGKISGHAVITWRKRDGNHQEVVFYDDDFSQESSSKYEITIKVGGQVVHVEPEVDGEQWEFANETIINSGQYFSSFTAEIRARSGLVKSHEISITVTR